MRTTPKSFPHSLKSVGWKLGLTAWLVLCLLLAVSNVIPHGEPCILDVIPGRTGEAVRQAHMDIYRFFTDHLATLPQKN